MLCKQTEEWEKDEKQKKEKAWERNGEEGWVKWKVTKGLRERGCGSTAGFNSIRACVAGCWLASRASAGAPHWPLDTRLWAQHREELINRVKLSCDTFQIYPDEGFGLESESFVHKTQQSSTTVQWVTNKGYGLVHAGIGLISHYVVS